MISSEAFVLSLGLLLGSLATWAFKRLPDERWQFLASVPIMKDSSGRWHGLNFTYYGLLTANALVFGVGMLVVLLGALHVPTAVTLTLIVAVLLLCLPAAKWVARLVDSTGQLITHRLDLFGAHSPPVAANPDYLCLGDREASSPERDIGPVS